MTDFAANYASPFCFIMTIVIHSYHQAKSMLYLLSLCYFQLDSKRSLIVWIFLQF